MIRDLKPLDGLFQRRTIFLLKSMALKNGLALKHLMKKQLHNAVASSTSTTLLQIFGMSSFSKPLNLASSPLCQPENSSLCSHSGPCRRSYQRTELCPQAEKCISSIPPCYRRVITDYPDLLWTSCSLSCPPKICYRKCFPLLKLLRLPNKIPAPSPQPPLPKHPKRRTSPLLLQCLKFLKCSLQKEHPSTSSYEPCSYPLSCSCFSSLFPLCRPSPCLKSLSYPPRPPLRSCPKCPPPPPCRSSLSCYVYLYSELPAPCSCSQSQNIEAKHSKDVPAYPKFLSNTGRNEVQLMSTYRIKLRPIQTQMLRSRGLHNSCILLEKSSSDSEKDCKPVSEICKFKEESCSKPCKEKDDECYPEKVKCEPPKCTKDKEKEEKLVCPKSCVRGGKCIITQVKKPDKMVYGPTECPPPRLVTPPVCPRTVDSENDEPVCNEKRVKPKKEVCTPPPLPGPPTEPISLCPCPPPPKVHPGPCPCPAHKSDIKVKPGRPCPIKDKYPCCLPTYYCPIKTTPCVRKPPCDKKKNTKS